MKASLSVLVVFFCFNATSAQKIEYSNGLIRTPSNGHVRLVSDVNGFHHLILLSALDNPVVHVFNSRLNLETSIKLNLKLPENCDVKLVRLKGYYLFYTHTQGSANHQLIKISAKGEASDISFLLNNPKDSVWNRSTASAQLFDKADKLVVVSHTYHEELKKIRTNIVELEIEKGISAIKQLFFPFDIEYDELSSVTLNDNSLVALKTSHDDEGQNALTVMRFDLITGKSLSRQFESGKYRYYNPAIRYSDADSGIFIYSMLTASSGYIDAKHGLFMVKLSSSLSEISPVSILSNIFKDNTVSTFTVGKDQTSGWISFSYFQKNGGLSMTMTTRKKEFADFTDVEPDFKYNLYDNYPNTNYPTAVLMTILNDLEKAKDSLIKNNGRYFKIHPWPYAHFVLNNTPYLLLIQELTARQKGLLLVFPNEKGEFETIPVRGYNRYDFALQLLQAPNDKYFIVPFTNKKEMGLMKVTLNN